MRAESPHYEQQSMFHYPRHIGDYSKDTGHLDMLEDGAYTRLMDLAYETERPLPVDLDALCRKVRARSPEERRAVEIVLKEFWKKTTKGWVQKRILREIDKFRGFLKHQSEAGRKSAEVRRNQRSTGGQPSLNGGSTGGQPESNLTENQNQNQNRKPKNRVTSNQPALPPVVSTPPALEAALAWAEKFSRGNAWGMVIDADMVRAWHDDRKVANWETPRGQHMVPIADWEADLRDFTKWKLGSAGKKQGGGFSPSRYEKPSVVVRVRTHPRLPEPPCDWRAVLRDLFPKADFPNLDHDFVPWGLMEPEDRRQIESECRRRSVLAADWVQSPVPPENGQG